MCVVCSVFCPAGTSAGEDDGLARHPDHVGESLRPRGIVFEAFGAYGDVEALVREVEVFAACHDVHTWPIAYVDADVFRGGEEVADSPVDIERTYLEDGDAGEPFGACLFETVEEVSLLWVCHLVRLAG